MMNAGGNYQRDQCLMALPPGLPILSPIRYGALRPRRGRRFSFNSMLIRPPDLPPHDAHRYSEETIDIILAAYPSAELQFHKEPVGMSRHRSWCGMA